MIKKGIFIAASLMIIACGSKGNSNINTPPTSQSIPEQSTPIIEPIKSIDPKPTPEIIKEDVAAIAFIGNEKIYEIDKKSPVHLASYSDCRIPKDGDRCPIYATYTDVKGDFTITVTKTSYNTMQAIYSGIANLTGAVNKAIIDCSNPTIFDMEFSAGSFSPNKVTAVKDECTTTGLILLPYIKADINWLNKDYFMRWIGYSTNPTQRFGGEGTSIHLSEKNN